MLAKVLPLRQDELAYTFRTILVGIEYRFRFWFNQRDSSWYVDLYDINDDPLMLGTRIVLGVLPIGYSYDDRFPYGAFVVVDTENTDVEPTETDLGTRVLILFYEYL